jgi:hypothetical protein
MGYINNEGCYNIVWSLRYHWRYTLQNYEWWRKGEGGWIWCNKIGIHVNKCKKNGWNT